MDSRVQTGRSNSFATDFLASIASGATRKGLRAQNFYTPSNDSRSSALTALRTVSPQDSIDERAPGDKYTRDTPPPASSQRLTMNDQLLSALLILTQIFLVLATVGHIVTILYIQHLGYLIKALRSPVATPPPRRMDANREEEEIGIQPAVPQPLSSHPITSAPSPVSTPSTNSTALGPFGNRPLSPASRARLSGEERRRHYQFESSSSSSATIPSWASKSEKALPAIPLEELRRDDEPSRAQVEAAWPVKPLEELWTDGGPSAGSKSPRQEGKVAEPLEQLWRRDESGARETPHAAPSHESSEEDLYAKGMAARDINQQQFADAESPWPRPLRRSAPH